MRKISFFAFQQVVQVEHSLVVPGSQGLFLGDNRLDFDVEYLLANTPSLLSFDQAAMVLEITTPTLARLVSLGEIPALDFPGEGQFILKSDLIKYIHLALFHNKPVLGTEISPNSPIKNAPDYPK